MTSRFNAPQQAETKMRRYVVGFLTKCAQAGLSEDEARRLIEESAMARGARQYEKDMRRRRRRDIAKSALGVLLALEFQWFALQIITRDAALTAQ